MADPTLLVISGPPGAGKSTVARLLAERAMSDDSPGPTVLVEGDRFFDFLAAGFVEPWLAESAAQNEVVVDASAAATGRFVQAGWATVFDGVIGPWFLDRFLARAGVTEVDYAVLLPPAERCRARVADRTGHGFVDLDATEKMHSEFSQATIAANHLFDNRDETPELTVGRIEAARRSGRLLYRS